MGHSTPEDGTAKSRTPEERRREEMARDNKYGNGKNEGGACPRLEREAARGRVVVWRRGCDEGIQGGEEGAACAWLLLLGREGELLERGSFVMESNVVLGGRGGSDNDAR